MTAEPPRSPSQSAASPERGEVPQRTAVPINIEDPRVYFAAERTLLAWIRTGVALIGLGFLVAKFGLFLRELTMLRRTNSPELPPTLEPVMLTDRSTLPDWIGGVIVVVGTVLALLAGLDHMRMVRRLAVDDFIGNHRRYLSGTLTVMVGITGILLAAYLMLL